MISITVPLHMIVLLTLNFLDRLSFFCFVGMVLCLSFSTNILRYVLQPSVWQCGNNNNNRTWEHVNTTHVIGVNRSKLVRKIQAGDFVERKDLLPDNIVLLEQWEAMPSSAHVCGMSHRTPRREVTSVTIWAACFATCVAILGQAHPHLVQDRLGYMQLVLCEARHHGGQSVQLGEPWARLQTSLVVAWALELELYLKSPVLIQQNRAYEKLHCACWALCCLDAINRFTTCYIRYK